MMLTLRRYVAHYILSDQHHRKSRVEREGFGRYKSHLYFASELDAFRICSDLELDLAYAYKRTLV